MSIPFLRRAGVVVLVVNALAAALATPSWAAPEPPPEPPSPVSGPVAHPESDGTDADRGPRGRDLGRAGEGMPQGLDVSAYQPGVDWGSVRGQGAQFAYVKATEGTSYQSPEYRVQYDGAAAAGLVRGGYHFALPDREPAPDQAAFFVDHGGRWTGDGRTLPPMLDIEYNPYGDDCYGLSGKEMTDWIGAFSSTVHLRTGRHPTIYTSRGFWEQCTGDSNGFGANPLFIARYDQEPGEVPASWQAPTFWQFDDEGRLPGDQDVFMGTPEQLRALAVGNPGAAGPAGPAPATTSTPAPSSSTAPEPGSVSG